MLGSGFRQCWYQIRHDANTVLTRGLAINIINSNMDSNINSISNSNKMKMKILVSKNIPM